MGSRGDKKPAFYEKLGQLPSAASSTDVMNCQMNNVSIVVDASRYIVELKERVEKLNEDVAFLQSASSRDRQSSLPAQVTVETLHKGFLINVSSDKNCPGLLVSILEAFEELGLDVLDARVSCSDKFHLQAVGEGEGQSDSVDEQVVKDAVLRAIMNWNDDPDQD